MGGERFTDAQRPLGAMSGWRRRNGHARPGSGDQDTPESTRGRLLTRGVPRYGTARKIATTPSVHHTKLAGMA
jgi:hypothetical protein